MDLKQSFQQSQTKTVKDFFTPAEKARSKPKPGDKNNFFTQLIQRAHTS